MGKLIEVVKKKNKAGVSVKPFQASNFVHKCSMYKCVGKGEDGSFIE